MIAGDPNDQSDSRPTKKLIRVSGRVQGVGFRYFVLNQSRRLGISGWVRNDVDGSVLIAAEGDIESLEDLLMAVRQGPPASRVDTVVVEPIADPASFELPHPFEVRY